MKRYRDKKGKFISKKEFFRRQKISIALKKYWSKRKSKPYSKSQVKKDYNRQYIERESRTNVIAYPNKKNKSITLTTFKKKYDLKTPINFLADLSAMDKVRNFFDFLVPKFIKIVKQVVKSKKKARLINVGYDITLGFQSLNDENDVTVNRTVSFLPGINTKDFTESRLKSDFDLIKSDITSRFVDEKPERKLDIRGAYLLNEYLYKFLFHGFELEIELV